MTMRLSIDIFANGDVAVRTVEKLGAEITKTGAKTKDMGRKGEVAAAQTKTIGTSAQASAASVETLSAAQTRNASTARAMASANGAAAGNMGNLVAQFNDIGVMMAAGQNPLTLALQQGTQISQVIGPMGAAGAVKSLGGAFLGMLNPISLITIGTIAGAAAFTQWAASAFGAKNNTDGLTDAVSELSAETDEANGTIALFNSGLQTTAQLTIFDGIAAKEAEIVRLLGMADDARGRTAQGLRNRAASIQTEIDAMRAANVERDNAVAKAERLQHIQDMANEAAQNYLARQRAQEADVATAQNLLTTLRDQASLQALINAHGQDSVEVSVLRASQERQVFEETLATLDVSEELKDQLRGALIIQQDIANQDVGAGIRGATADAVGLAEQLGVSLSMLSRIQSFGPQGLGDSNGNVYSGRGGDPRTLGGSTVDRFVSPDTDAWIAAYKPPSTSTRRSGGASSAANTAARDLARQREGVTDLIASLGDEIAILRASDPIQKEMLRNRETLDAATTAERETIEKLISSRNAEEAAIERQSLMYDNLRDAGKSAFDELLNNRGDLEAMFDSLTASLADMVYQSLLLGEGPLGSGGGGILGTLATAATSAFSPSSVNAAPLSNIQAKAGGGMIYGPGSGTSDDVLAWLSNGEFVATAEATSKYRPYLEAMNAGSFATGGAADGSTYSGGGFGGVLFSPKIAINNQSSTPVRGEMREESDGNGGRQYALVLADAVGGALQQSGGGAKRTLRNTYGVRQRGARR